ncbi:MAG: hypothetical protein QXF52_02550 [Thermoproteota archaeon]
MSDKTEHILKRWEKRYGYLGLSKKEYKFFSPVIGKRFTLKFLGKKLYERKIDNEKRIWVSYGILRDLKVGDIIVFSHDEKNYFVEEKQ